MEHANAIEHEFGYECPHCGETVVITDDVMGSVVDCPLCENPFKVDVPTAHPADRSRVNGDTPEVDRAERAEGELIVTHPAMFRADPFWFALDWGLVLLGVAGILLSMWWSVDVISRSIQILAGGLLIVSGLGLLGAWWLKTRYTTLTVTTKRTILRKGLIAKNTSEVQHDDVRNLQVDQNIFERIVGVGDLAVSSAGQAGLEIHVQGIPKPDYVAETIRGLQ